MSHQAIRFLGAIGGTIACLAGATLARAAAAGSDINLAPVFAVTSFQGGKTFLTPQALCVDAERGDVYVADTGHGRIVVFDPDGQFVSSFKHTPDGGGAAEPVGVAVDQTGRVYVTDTSSHVIYLYDLRGRLTSRIRPADTDALFGRMTVDGSGSLYSTVRNRGQVLLYDSSRTPKLTVGGQAEAPRLEMICDVAIGAPGRIFALSSLGTAVHVYDANGKRLFAFGEHSPGAGNVSFPTALDVDGEGRVWVADSFAGSIKIYTSEGKFLKNIGGLDFPVDLAIWPKGNRILVLEKNARRLSSYRISEGGARS